MGGKVGDNGIVPARCIAGRAVDNGSFNEENLFPPIPKGSPMVDVLEGGIDRSRLMWPLLFEILIMVEDQE